MAPERRKPIYLRRCGHELKAREACWHLELRKLCLLYTSDAADERSSVDLGGRRIIKKKKNSINT